VVPLDGAPLCVHSPPTPATMVAVHRSLQHAVPATVLGKRPYAVGEGDDGALSVHWSVEMVPTQCASNEDSVSVLAIQPP
jgi:hypothetical protein